MSAGRLLISRSRIAVKRILKVLLALPGCLLLPFRSKPPAIRVLHYHRVNPYPQDRLSPTSRELTVRPVAFERQLAYLARRGYRTLSPDDFLAAMQGRAAVPPKAVLITFDDGFEDNLLFAAPALQRFGYGATIFIVADFAGREAGEIGWDADAPGFGRLLSWDQIRQMQAEGFRFGSHTRTHPMLTRLDDAALRRELADSRREIGARLGAPAALLAYPGGDFDARVEAAAAAAGYEAAFTTVPGVNAPGAPATRLRRTEISASDSLFVFRMKLAGALDWIGFKERPAFRRLVAATNRWLVPRAALRAARPHDQMRAPQRGRPRLLFLVTRLDTGGVPEHVMSLIAGLVDRYDITLACHEAGAAHRARLAALGVGIVPVGLRRLPSPLADLRALIGLTRLFRRERFDIVHTHMSKAALLGGVAARAAGVPAVINTAHNLGFLALSNPVARAVFWLQDALLFRTAFDMVVTVSDRVREGVVRAGIAGPEKVVAIPNGLDASRFRGQVDTLAARAQLGLAPGDRVVVTVARLVWFKGLETLIDAAARVAGEIGEVVFLLVGDGPLEAKLRAQAAAAGLAGRVRFLGERDDVPRLLAMADLFVLPSVSEGMPISVLEAMAAGKPVIASSVGGVPELVADGETGLLVPPRDAGRLADALLVLLRDHAARARMGRAARLRIDRRFTREMMISATDALYRRVMAGRRPPAADALRSA